MGCRSQVPLTLREIRWQVHAMAATGRRGGRPARKTGTDSEALCRVVFSGSADIPTEADGWMSRPQLTDRRRRSRPIGCEPGARAKPHIGAPGVVPLGEHLAPAKLIDAQR